MKNMTLTQISTNAWAVLMAFFLCVPIVAILPISFSSGAFLSYPLPGLSMQWYHQVLQPYPWIFSLKNSLIVGVASTFLSVVLGTLAAYGLTGVKFRGKTLVNVVLMLPMVVPVVISALSMYFFLNTLGLLGTYTGLIIAHTALAMPFVIVTVAATLQGFDRNLVRAASSLGCHPARTFMTVTLPLILPGVVSGAIFAFITSFDEVVVALFVSSPSTLTLPRQLFSGLRDQVTPALVAIATLLIILSLLLMATVGFLSRRTERLTQTAH